MKKLIVLFVFISSFLFCGANSIFAGGPKSELIYKGSFTQGKDILFLANLMSSENYELNIDSLFNSNGKINISEKNRLIKLKLFFKEVNKKEILYTVIDNPTKTFSVIKISEDYETDSYLIIFWIIPFVLLLISGKNMYYGTHNAMSLICAFFIAVSIVISIFIDILMIVNNDLTSYFQMFSALFTLCVVIVLYYRDTNYKLDFIFCYACLILSLIFILL